MSFLSNIHVHLKRILNLVFAIHNRIMHGVNQTSHNRQRRQHNDLAMELPQFVDGWL